MQSTHAVTLEVKGPEHLGLETRAAFRQEAMARLNSLPEDGGRLVIDLQATRSVDSAGLGVLMLVQRRAAERNQVVVLHRPNDELRFLLVLTKLDDLFEVQAEAA
jgi:anti-anti-sigma factor